MGDTTSGQNGSFYNGRSRISRYNFTRMGKSDTKDGVEARPSDKNIGIRVLGA